MYTFSDYGPLVKGAFIASISEAIQKACNHWIASLHVAPRNDDTLTQEIERLRSRACMCKIRA
jgi:hypothetical protein